MKGISVVLFCLLLLTGCERGIVLQAVEEVKLALDQQAYERVNSLLFLASVESSSRKFTDLHRQSIYLIRMQEYKEANEWDRLFLAWTDLNLVTNESDLIKAEGIRLIQRMLVDIQDVALKGLENGNTREIKNVIRLIENRLGTFELFEAEIEGLIELRRQMEES